MDRPRRRRILWLAGCAVAALVLAAGLARPRAPALPPLPQPNAYDDFVQAGESLVGDPSDAPTMSPAELRALVLTNAESLRLFRLGLTRACSVPTAQALTNFDARMSDLAALKRLALLAAAAGRLAELEGRTNDAADVYLAGLRFGNEISRGGLIIHRLVGMACEAIACTHLAKLLPALGGEPARKAITDLEKLDASAVTWAEVWANEKIYIRRAVGGRPVAWLQTLFGTGLRKAKIRHHRAVAQRRLLLVQLSLQCYQAEYGKPPARLPALTSKFLKQIPPDPFSGRPLVYRPQGTNWMLYSVGPDGVDNGGLRSTRGGRTVKVGLPFLAVDVPAGDMFYDSSW